ncbi:MAG: hypothetical protein ACPHQD_13265 [Vibrio toranzoniae]|uniref:hypothetical protein n=1 Tax=Vibrio toranzoniae TaxID=1194427 RepID=UPI003C32FF7F
MTLTRQHFQLVADLLRNNARHRMRNPEYVLMCEEVADQLEQFNAAFDRDRFVDACL